MVSNRRPVNPRSRSRRKPKALRQNRTLGFIQIGVIAAVALFFAWSAYTQFFAPTAPDLNTDGQQLQKVTMSADVPSQTIPYKGMTVSFNPETHQPNWVAWELLTSETDGETERWNRFTQDPAVEGCPVADDYKNTGFDRGHMAPAGDMKWNDEAMRQTFYLTNICPQHPDLNRGSWKKLEEKCRVKAVEDSALIIVCGPIFYASKNGNREYIGHDTKIPVPDAFFKVVLSPFKPEPEGIGFIMPNERVKGGMQVCAVTIDSVETLTGYDFFSSLPDDLEEQLEAQNNFPRWSTRSPRR